MPRSDAPARASPLPGAARNPPPRLRSLRTRFLLAFILVALLGVGVVALVTNRVTASQFALYIRRGGEGREERWAVLAAEYYARTGSWEGVGSVFANTFPGSGPGQGRGGPGRGQGMQGEAAPFSDRFLIIAPDGTVLYDSTGELEGQAIQVDYQQYGAPIVVDERAVGWLLITTADLTGHSALEQHFINAVNRAVLLAVLLVMVASLVAAALLSRRLVAPLRRLTTAAEALAGGDLAQRVEVRSQDEVGELGWAFNKMAQDLQDAEAARRQMTADIAHELRNPLSVIRGNLEAIHDGVYPADDEHLAPIYEETILLQRLVEDLRLLSLADAGQLQLVRTDVGASELLHSVADAVQAAAGEKRIAIRVEDPHTPLLVDGDRDRLRQVIGNLASNALRYTLEGGTITLAARAEGEQVHISVSDTGKGISPQDLPHVFDRFYRGDTARDRAAGGSGLGLAIARALVEAHEGTIDVESTVGQGTTFHIRLTRSRDSLRAR
jgi:signal transduction histidine kinase